METRLAKLVDLGKVGYIFDIIEHHCLETNDTGIKSMSGVKLSILVSISGHDSANVTSGSSIEVTVRLRLVCRLDESCSLSFFRLLMVV